MRVYMVNAIKEKGFQSMQKRQDSLTALLQAKTRGTCEESREKDS